MKRKLLLTACFATLAAIPALAETEKLSDAEREARNKHLQILNDRLINGKPQFSMSGTLKSIGGNRYSVNGEEFVVDSDTIVQGKLVTNTEVEVRGFLTEGEPKLATQVVELEHSSDGAKSNIESKSEEGAVNEDGAPIMRR
jgi:hypothetical protein